MKILFMRPQVEMGGVSRHMLLLAEALEARGHSVSVATSGGDWVARFPSVHHASLYPSSPHKLLLAVAQLARLVRREQIEILHSHHRFTTLVGRGVAWLARVPLVCTVHEFKTNWSGMARLWLAPWVCVPTLALREHLVRVYAALPERISVIQIGPEPTPPAPVVAARLRQELVGAAAGPVVGYIGRLAPEKGVGDLLAALPDVFRAAPAAHALIVGDGVERAALQHEARRLGVAERVHFVGARADGPLVIEAMDVVVAPSLTENFSLSVAEAMAAGRPVVATRVGGLVELVEENVTGLFAPPADPAALARRIVELLQDPERSARFGAAARRTATHWSPAQAAGGMEAFYRRAVETAFRRERVSSK